MTGQNPYFDIPSMSGLHTLVSRVSQGYKSFQIFCKGISPLFTCRWEIWLETNRFSLLIPHEGCIYRYEPGNSMETILGSILGYFSVLFCLFFVLGQLNIPKWTLKWKNIHKFKWFVNLQPYSEVLVTNHSDESIYRVVGGISICPLQ